MYDFSKYTDDQLLEKRQSLTKNLMGLPPGSGMSNSIQSMIEMMDLEWSERMVKYRMGKAEDEVLNIGDIFDPKDELNKKKNKKEKK
jgi:hypothetical protein|tara:strand:+ start:478 stop:738 length:261 start_codon:yes stop_codon:yes gene_type:complete